MIAPRSARSRRFPGDLALISAVMLSAVAADAEAEPFALERTFNDPTPTEDLFGSSVALDGDRALVGAPFDASTAGGSFVGQGHLFDVVDGGLKTTFDEPTPTDNASFGSSVALDGNRILVGARFDDTAGDLVGQAHLFDDTGNRLVTFDDPSPNEFGGDIFGFSVALDDDRVLIGAPRDNTTGDDVGQAHLFDADTGNLLATFDDPTPTRGDGFGQSVAFDGNRLLIGAPNDDTAGSNVGQAHLFDADTRDLLATFDDPTPTGSDNFGESLTLDGDRVLIGAPFDDTVGDSGDRVGQAHLFDAETGELLNTFDDPSPTPIDAFGGDRFGWAVALNGDQVLIGAPNHSDNLDVDGGFQGGQAHLFDLAGSLLQTFEDPTPTGRDSFGFSAALDADQLLIGARRDDTNGDFVGQAHLFTSIDEPAAVPLPPTLALFGVGLLGMWPSLRRRACARA